MRLDPVYKAMCPNCGGDIAASRLERGLPCAACYPGERPSGVEEIARELASRERLWGYLWLYDLEVEYSEFSRFFEKKTGSSLWSAQRSWARRLLSLESLAIIAPTGVGKTTLLQAYASFRAARDGWRILYLVPTENLARQVASRITRLAGEDAVAYYYSSMAKRLREEALERISRGDWRILIVTTGFLQRRFDLLKPLGPFNLIIVDDVDSLLRNSKNIDRVLLLLGFPPEAVEAAERLVKYKLKLYTLLAAGKKDAVEELEAQIAELERRLSEEIPEEPGQLVIASATGRPRGSKHLIFRELLGFEVGGGSDYLRDVTDSYIVSESVIEELPRIVSMLGSGGVVFVSQLYGKQAARIVKAKLEAEGVRVALALSGGRRAVEKLANGEVDVIVGVASRYGVIVRGLDLPERIRYAVFLGVPARKMSYDDAVASPRRLLAILFYLADRGDVKANEYIKRIRTMLDRITDYSIVTAAYKGRVKPEGLLKDLVDAMAEAASYAKHKLLDEASRGPVRIGGIVVERSDDRLWVIIPDAPTYIQASGRTSRLLNGAMTHGLSIVVDENEARIRALEERLQYYTSTRFVELSELDVGKEIERIETSRKGGGKRVNVKTLLLIVESPTKARTIAWFWGRPSKRRSGRLTIYETSALDPETGTVYLLTITATRGHLYDLTIEDVGFDGVILEDGKVSPVYDSVKRCLDCGYQYAGPKPCPRCGSTRVVDASTIVSTLRKLATQVDEIVIASDPDREGEKIAWDVYLALKPYNPRIKRGRFHEVTRRAVLEALRNASEIDRHLVEAQIVRRVEDRWIGFMLSKHLWAVYGKSWLGAGRVQTPVLGWIIDRYEEWRRERGYLVVADTEVGWRARFYTRDKGEAARSAEAGYVEILEVELWEEDSNPPPPFTTDSLIYEASKRYGYSARLTMKLAQDLFESGLITYHRTDSTRVSSAGISIAREYLERHGMAGEFQARGWGEGGAHEAIRPTRPLDVEELERKIYDGTLRVPIKLTRAHLKLYDLIFRRFIASQMKPARIVRARVKARIGSLEEEFTVNVRPTSWGYTRVYETRWESWAERVERGDRLLVREVRVVRASPVRLYTSGDVVKLMRERGIGRPSTYAKAIEANRRHGYIVESKRRGYLIPTSLGKEVYNYLVSNFYDLVSEETSRRMEAVLAEVEAGSRDPVDAIVEIYEKVNTLVETASSMANVET